MSKTISTLQVVALVIIGFIIGISAWFFRETSSVASVIIDAVPLAQENSVTNIMVLGIGGEGHDGSDLTDTIMLVSLNHANRTVKLLSIPRDIWVNSLKIKINAAYHYGNENESNGGIKLAKQALSDVLGVPIQYAAVIDFSGFIKLIDVIGGIDVQVVRTFDDYKYPIAGKENAEPESDRYEHLHFEQGLAHFDGVTALKYARSRHALGEEGTDFARGARQQQIVQALRDKLFSSQTLLNLNTITQIVTSLKSSIDTDITELHYRSFFQFGLSFKQANTAIISSSITDYLSNPKDLRPYGGAWVLIPNQELKSYVAKFIQE